MAKKKASKIKTTKNAVKHISSHSTWIIGLLLVTLLIVTVLGTIGVKHLQANSRTKLDVARLEVFDDVAKTFIESQEIRADQDTVQEVTGYGISNEDGVFYITFNYYVFSESGEEPVAHPAIVYFWKDEERGTYSHAFSYHDDSPSYHPEGIYVDLTSK